MQSPNGCTLPNAGLSGQWTTLPAESAIEEHPVNQQVESRVLAVKWGLKTIVTEAPQVTRIWSSLP